MSELVVNEVSFLLYQGLLLNEGNSINPSALGRLCCCREPCQFILQTHEQKSREKGHFPLENLSFRTVSSHICRENLIVTMAKPSTCLGSRYALSRSSLGHSHICSVSRGWMYPPYVRCSSGGELLHSLQGQRSILPNKEESTECLVLPLCSPKCRELCILVQVGH